MLKSVLIANRGEIAVRLIRCCRALGARAVAVYSDADKDAQHARLADSAARIGAGPARESYLDAKAILAAAAAERVEAIHPGYGFLSENPDFARAVGDAGLIFIGPSPEVVAMMADKTAARAAAVAAGLPVLPGAEAVADAEAAKAAAREIGYPLLVKAAFGGGGRGMRLAHDETALAAAIEEAAREAKASFGRGEVFLERYVERPRHVEAQVFGDKHGHVVHLGDRDCSMQRRHQKIVEEAPAPNLSREIRAALREAAVKLARSVNYVGAGTVEFLVDAAGESFYFLEMNTRLQVEHGVTEMTTGIDLAKLQILVAGGAPLPFSQNEIQLRGHAIQGRVAAEDPARGFAPSAGRIARLSLPSGPWLRCDFGFEPGDSVPPFYDSMLGKVIAWGEDREEAARRLSAALSETRVEGVATNVGFLRRLADSEAFLKVSHDVSWIERQPAPEPEPSTSAPQADEDEMKDRPGAFRREILHTPQGELVLDVFTSRPGAGPRATREVRGGALSASVEPAAKSGPVAPIDATVVSIAVAEGDAVTAQTVLATLEAMKMELPVTAGADGVVVAVHARVGDTVKTGALICTIGAAE